MFIDIGAMFINIILMSMNAGTIFIDIAPMSTDLAVNLPASYLYSPVPTRTDDKS